MSHNPNPDVDTSGFNYPSAAGVRTNLDQTHTGTSLTATSSSTVPMTTTHSTLNSHIIDPNFGKLGGEHGGAGTRADDRKGELVHNDGHTATPVATKEQL